MRLVQRIAAAFGAVGEKIKALDAKATATQNELNNEKQVMMGYNQRITALEGQVAPGQGAQEDAPAGQIALFACSTAPAGWLIANGAAISRTAYSKLFTAIGTTYGVGDGKATFALPDLRGLFLRSWDAGKGVDRGRAFGSRQEDQLRSHFHAFAGRANDIRLTQQGYATSRAWFESNAHGATQAAGGDETRPVNIALLACIKY